MTGFTLNRVPAIAVGPGRIDDIGADVTQFAGGLASVLLVCDPALAALGLTGRTEAALAAGGHRVAIFDAFTADPGEAQIADGAAVAWETKAQAIVGLGGGSALDAAKMIATTMMADRSLETYRLAAVPLPERRARLICVPTTAGTGSEATSVSILSGPDKTKYWFWGQALKPDFVIVDPELTVGLPPAMTVATGLDALVHAMEAATNRAANPGNDFYTLASIRRVVGYLPTAYAEPDNIGARTRLLLAATMAGAAIDNVGTALAHNIGHALGSLMPVHHGRAVALAMEATLPWVIEGNRRGFGRVANAFGLGADPDALPARFTALLDELGFDRSLPETVDAAALAARMAAPENSAMRMATARDITDADLHHLAASVLAKNRSAEP